MAQLERSLHSQRRADAEELKSLLIEAAKQLQPFDQREVADALHALAREAGPDLRNVCNMDALETDGRTAWI